MNYAVNGGAGNFEIVFSPLYATTGEGFEMPEVTIPTVDPSIKTSTFMSFSAIDREDAYGNPPDKVTYDKNGGVTLKSINTKVQHQIAYYFSDKEQTNTALAIANREGGTNTVEITVTVIDAKDINNNTGKVEIQIMLFSNPDVNGYQPANVTVQQWQEVGTSKTYYINVGDYKSYSNCYYVKLCAMNYWYYDESGNLIEHPDWNDGHKYTSAEIAPTVHFSKMIVSEKRYDEVEEIVYGDCNSDGDVNVKDVLALRKYLAKWDVQINMDAADVNVDGKVDTLDVLRLRKFLANWDVELGKA